jgi:transposase InsO family protein
MCATVDGGPEFAGEFRRACERLGIARDQLPARSPNLNVSLERFQGSCLHLQDRNAFRYRFYENADDVDADPGAWLRFYNFERPHRGGAPAAGPRPRCATTTTPTSSGAKGWDPDELIA